MRYYPSKRTIKTSKQQIVARKRGDKQLDEIGLEYVPTSYQEFGYAGEEMLDYFLKKMGYDGKHFPETAFSIWKRCCYGNPFNQYIVRIKARGIDNWIKHPTKGRINFEVKNFGHIRFGNKSTSKLTYKKVLGTEVIGKFHPRLEKSEICILVVSHDEVVPEIAKIPLSDCGVKIIVYDMQVLPNRPETFKRAMANLYHTQLPYIVKPPKRVKIQPKISEHKQPEISRY